jgi:hypothetical protein
MNIIRIESEHRQLSNFDVHEARAFSVDLFLRNSADANNPVPIASIPVITAFQIVAATTDFCRKVLDMKLGKHAKPHAKSSANT